MRVLHRIIFAILSLPTLGFASAEEANQAPKLNELVVYVDEFVPYINPEHQPLGNVARTLRTLAEYSDMSLQWHYVPYSDATQLLRLGKHGISYPYFFTEQRSKNFYFSKPVAQIVIRLFYNRRFADISQQTELDQYKFGIVNGYSYGEKIDKVIVNADVFESDLDALNALMNGEIDILPMAEGVMNQMLENSFAQQRELIRTIDAVSGTEYFHIMAPKTDFGKKIIEKFDNAIVAKFGNQPPVHRSVKPAPKADVAELIPAEGFPAITGVDVQNQQTYTLPIGTKVIVIDWSDSIEEPTEDSAVNRNMLFTSNVVILNGPHVGKEMLIRNMHIQLE